MYRVYGSKRAVLFELLDQMGAQWASAQVRHREQAAAGDPHEQLRVEVEHIVAMFDQWIDFAQVVMAVAGSDPAVAAVGQEGDRRRRLRQRPLVTAWARSGLLRPDVPATRAADILCAMTSAEVYALMADTLGWRPRLISDWLADTLEHQLFGTPHPNAGGS